MTASAQPASKADRNGKDKPADTPVVTAERRHGAELLREHECYYLTGLIEQCLSEAQRLVYKLHREAADRFTDYDGARGTEPLDYQQARVTLREVHDCGVKALAYIHQVRAALPVSDGEPPLACDERPF